MSDPLFRIYDETTDRFDSDGYPWQWSHGDEFWSPIKDIVRDEADNRCVRCGHPYAKGDGEWSRCDRRCTHLGPVMLRDFHGDDWFEHDLDTIGQPAGEAIYDADVARFEVKARWRILTVHHLNENKADCRWWNLASLCQRCHLTIQGKVKMDRPYDRPHTSWFIPYVAGFYAAKYLNLELTREQALARVEELLALELRQEPLFDRGAV